MYPKHHIVISTLVALLLYPKFGTSALLVIPSGVFLDLDHVCIYLKRFRSLNFKKAYEYFSEVTDASEFLLPLHSVEVLFVVFLASMFNEIFLLVAFGMALHILLDLIYDRRIRRANKFFSMAGWLANRSLKSA